MGTVSGKNDIGYLLFAAGIDDGRIFRVDIRAVFVV
jgi:hypothetical protein